MGTKENIKSYIVKAGYTITRITEILNQKHGTNHSPQNLSKKIQNETLRYNEAEEIAEVIGHKIEWIKKE